MTLFEKALINNKQSFISDNYNVNMQDETGKTLLHYAVIGSAHDVIDILLKKGANVNLLDNELESPIFDCARKGKLEIAKSLIISHAQLNKPNKKGEYLIHLAATKGNKTFIQLLVENKSLTNIKTEAGLYPVHYAILAGHIDIIKYILGVSHQSFNLIDQSNNTLLHYAAQTTNDLLIYFLISEGINPNLLNNKYETPLFNAARFGTKETVLALLANDAYIDLFNIRGEAPIDVALIYNKYDIETALINYKMLPKYERLTRRQSLALSVLNREFSDLQKQINNLNTMRLDKFNYSALDYARLYQFKEAIEILKHCPII